MKKAHEVTAVLWSNFTPNMVAEWLMTTARDKPYLHTSKSKCPIPIVDKRLALRITIRVELVDPPAAGGE